MPSAEAVVAMVNEGWDFDTLMDMGLGDFGFWHAAQAARNKAVAAANKEQSRQKR